MGKPVASLAARVEALSAHISNENDGYFGGSAPEDHFGNIESYIERLESRSFEPRWIPIDERLPDDDITVMIAMKNGDEPVWLGYYDGDCWYSVDATPIRTRVTHWRPMPAGPNG